MLPNSSIYRKGCILRSNTLYWLTHLGRERSSFQVLALTSRLRRTSDAGICDKVLCEGHSMRTFALPISFEYHPPKEAVSID